YVSVRAGMLNTAALRSDGTIAAWLGTTFSPLTPVPPVESGLGFADIAMGGGSGYPVVIARVAALGSFTRIGLGCAGSRPAAPIVPSDIPRLGGALRLCVRELPVDAAFLVLGFSTTTSSFGPLPFALGAVGMPGCTAYVGDEVVLFASGSNHEAVSTLD